MSVITLSSADLVVLQRFSNVQPGMELHCTYKLQGNKGHCITDSKKLVFTGPVIQKTEHLFAVRDKKSKRVHCLSLYDCICGHGQYKVINT